MPKVRICFPCRLVLSMPLHPVIWVSCQLHLNVHKPLFMQFAFIHCQRLHDPTLPCSRLSKGNYSLHNLLHPMLHILFCRVAGGLGDQPSQQPAPDTRSAVLPSPRCLLACPNTVRNRALLKLCPKGWFCLPVARGHFPQELLGHCSWQLPLLLITNVHL